MLLSPALSLAAQAPGQAFTSLLNDQEGQIVGAAEAMPADKFNYAPTSGEFKVARTFAPQIAHVAQAQYFFFGGFGVKPAIDPQSIGKLKSKEEIVAALKASFAYAKKAAVTITPENAFADMKDVDGASTRATIAAVDLAHNNDHYGQMVVYLRLNGIVPPASRK